jgi:type IV pilus assembly protein PilE
MKTYQYNMAKVRNGKGNGFTLIELMIVVAIVGILTAVAYPAYRSHVLKSNRASAKAFMQVIANKQEQLFPDQRAYSAATVIGDFAIAPFSLTVPTDVSDYYAVTAAVTTNPPGYTITAAPKSGSVQASDGNLTLNNKGVKTGTW